MPPELRLVGDHGSSQGAPEAGRPWHAVLPELVLPGAKLREPRISDTPALCELLATDAVARHMSPPPATAAGFERFVTWIQGERRARRGFCFGIVPTGRDHSVGLVQVRQLEPEFVTAEWGFALGQAYWGTGLFAGCAAAVVDFSFRHVRTHRLEARASSENGRGNGVLHKLGAVAEGVLRKSFQSRTGPTDQVLWSLLDDDWLLAHPAAPYERVDRPEEEEESSTQKPAGTAKTDDVPWRHGLPELPGTRVSVRELVPDDAPHLVRLLSNEDVNRYSFEAPSNRQGFERFIRWTHDRRQEGQYLCFGIVPAGSGHAVGLIQLRQLEPGFRTAEWGFAIGVPYWGTGLFVEAANLVLRFAFETMSVHRIEARTALVNGRANGALRKLGAAREGRLRRSFLVGNEYHDDILWALLADDWRRTLGVA